MSSKSLEKCDISKNLGNTEKNEDERTTQKTIPHSIVSILNMTDSKKKEEQKEEAEIENGTRDGRKQPGMKKSIVFPFMIRSKDKVEILPYTNVWMFKNDFHTMKLMSKYLCLCPNNKHYKMVKFLLFCLMGVENFQYLSYKDNSKYIGLPEIIRFVIKTFTKQSCQSRCKYSERHIMRFIKDIFKKLRKNIVTEISCGNNGGEIEEDEIEMLYDKQDRENTPEKFIKYDNIKTLLQAARQRHNMLTRELYKADELHTLIERDEREKEEISIPENEKKEKEMLERQAERGIVIFPYMIQSSNKVELIHGSNVWIFKSDLNNMTRKCEALGCADKHRMMISFLLKVLLHTTNLKYMSVTGCRQGTYNYTIQLPKEVHAAILQYATRKCEAKDCVSFTNLQYYSCYMDSIFVEARSLKRNYKCRDSEDSENRKRVNEDEQNDSAIDKRIKVFENTSAQAKIFSPLSHVPQSEPLSFCHSPSAFSKVENSCNSLSNSSSQVSNLRKYRKSSFSTIPSKHVSAVANLTGNQYNPSSIPKNVGFDYSQAVYDSHLVSYLQDCSKHRI